jgi:EAL domain-containing protein (putative c-di-GMP-specific phosphodiesterase class I)
VNAGLQESGAPADNGRVRRLAARPSSPEPVSAGELRAALARDELVAFFQPQIDLVSEVVLGIEALVRWQHPQRGLLSPAAFLDAATVHGLLGPLTEHMLRTSLEALKRFRRSGHDLTVSVNVGPETLASPAFVTTVADLLAELDVAAPRLRLEVTETAFMESGDAAIEALGRLRSLGLGASLDDFGTGFSSLARLRAMPIDELKIDRSFVADMRSRGDMTVVRMIIDLARHLELRVVAEGVEEREDLAVLAGLGCDAAQGYWVARPAPADDLEAWLLDRRQAVSLRPRCAALEPDSVSAERPTRRNAALSPALTERLDDLLRSVAAEHGYEVAACWARADDEDALHWAAGWSARDAGAEAFIAHSRSMVFAPGFGLPGRTWQTARPLVIPDVAADGRMRRLRTAMAAGFRTALGLPLHGDDEVVGVIELFARSEHTSGPATADALADLCAHVGEMIARDRARARAAHLEQTLTGAADGLAALRRGAGTDAVCADVASAALAIANADAVVLWEPAPGGQRLRASHAIGWPDGLPELSIVEGRSGAAATFGSGTSTFIADAARHALPHAGLVAQLPVASAFYQPIHRGARVAGVLALAWKRPRHALSPATRTALALVADAASMALGRPQTDGMPRFTR